jgi:hypothetical protein
MLHDVRTLVCQELDARYEQVDLRTPWMRIAVTRGRNVTSDFALVDRATSFVGRTARKGRNAMTLVLRGHARFEEAGRRGWLEEGSFVASELARGGTEAYAGDESEVIAFEWDTEAMEAPHDGAFRIERISSVDRVRLREVRLARASALVRAERDHRARRAPHRFSFADGAVSCAGESGVAVAGRARACGAG